ncbi:MAG: amidase [Pseudomonas sp.]|uniref:amidase n=1 Tax=Pseudomonas sp. TaxID=306 RepID=UPI003D0A7373
MSVRNLALAGLLGLLGACSVKPVDPYSEPPLGTAVAQLRVITNGEVRGAAYAGCLPDSQRLAKAGRFVSGHRPNVNYPQFPEVPRQLDMLARFAPKLPDYPGAIRRGEGDYSEVVTEYRVPAGRPFLLDGGGVAAGGSVNTYRTCPQVQKVVVFEPGKSYEAYVGLNYIPVAGGEVEAMCVFTVYQLLPLSKPGASMPLALPTTQPAQQRCSGR